MIEASIFTKSIISASNNLFNHQKELNELNVFPVPDGDTGTNMYMTISCATDAIQNIAYNELHEKSLSSILEIVSSEMIRGARGNSGVILSLIFRAFAQSFKQEDNLNLETLKRAMMYAKEASYGSVMNPTEGTMLTVIRELSEMLENNNYEDLSMSNILDKCVIAAREVTEKTKEMLPILKNAGVVDSGAKGVLYIIEAIVETIKSGKIIEKTNQLDPKVSNTLIDIPQNKITYKYCTEFIITEIFNKSDSKLINAYLETIGDSVIFIDDEEIIKIHLHTNNPGLALEKAISFGQLINIKIDNMAMQYKKRVYDLNKTQINTSYVPIDPSRKYGLISIVSGKGVEELFLDMGADKIIQGGTTMNPSTSEILETIQSVPAKNIFVIPNNKNIIMSCEQAATLSDREVRIIKSTSIPQGINSMIRFDPNLSPSENHINMNNAINEITTGYVTYATKNTVYQNHKIKENDIIAIRENQIEHVEKDPCKALIKLIKSSITKNSKYLTIIYGNNVTESQAQTTYKVIMEKYGSNRSINLINGSQPIYYYILSIE